MEQFVLVWLLLVVHPFTGDVLRAESGAARFASKEACLGAEKRLLTNIETYNKPNKDKILQNQKIEVVSTGCDGSKLPVLK